MIVLFDLIAARLRFQAFRARYRRQPAAEILFQQHIWSLFQIRPAQHFRRCIFLVIRDELGIIQHAEIDRTEYVGFRENKHTDVIDIPIFFGASLNDFFKPFACGLRILVAEIKVIKTFGRFIVRHIFTKTKVRNVSGHDLLKIRLHHGICPIILVIRIYVYFAVNELRGLRLFVIQGKTICIRPGRSNTVLLIRDLHDVFMSLFNIHVFTVEQAGAAVQSRSYVGFISQAPLRVDHHIDLIVVCFEHILLHICDDLFFAQWLPLDRRRVVFIPRAARTEQARE